MKELQQEIIWFQNGDIIDHIQPVTGKLIAKVKSSTKEDYEAVVSKATEAFKTWRMVPAPKRGEIVRQIGDALREKKDALGNWFLMKWEKVFRKEETFAPILYVLKYSTIEEAIEIQNGVPQGLSSSIFTNNVREMELFLSQAGSDCGMLM
ncbi:hypothetical protein FQR65_LT19771 [Abscondita terminalis]|nr:hypothetical protein FQR65_LT19771 [Abscondita terminalis]